MRIKTLGKIALFILLAAFLSGCATPLAVRAPAGMFVSTGDYMEGITTLGMVQVHQTVLAPFLILNLNKVRENLYEKLIDKATLISADGVTNITFYSRLSTWTYLSIFILSPAIDVYMEGVAIKVD